MTQLPWFAEIGCGFAPIEPNERGRLRSSLRHVVQRYRMSVLTCRRTLPARSLTEHSQHNAATADKAGVGDVDLQFVGEIALGIKSLAR